MQASMRAMVLQAPGRPLQPVERPLPTPGPGEVLLRVEACAVCRTDLHIVDGELPVPRLPIVPGHEIVGIVEAIGAGVTGFGPGRRAGMPWLGRTCGRCAWCRDGRENLCDAPLFTGHGRDGGFATHVVVDAAHALPLDGLPQSAAQLAPLLCAGLIGWRCLRRSGDSVRRLGLYGFGAAAHLVTQVAVHEGRDVLAFTRPGDTASQRFARSLGACWAGAADQAPPQPLDAAIIFAPDGALVPRALAAVRKGGRVVCGGIHMSDIPSFPYRLLWQERELCSVANLTHRDGLDFLAAVRRAPVSVHASTYPLERANDALDDLRHGRIQGAAVLLP